VSLSIGASFSSFGVRGEGGFQVVFGVENGLSIVHFSLGQLELFVI